MINVINFTTKPLNTMNHCKPEKKTNLKSLILGWLLVSEQKGAGSSFKNLQLFFKCGSHNQTAPELNIHKRDIILDLKRVLILYDESLIHK